MLYTSASVVLSTVAFPIQVSAFFAFCPGVLICSRVSFRFIVPFAASGQKEGTLMKEATLMKEQPGGFRSLNE